MTPPRFDSLIFDMDGTLWDAVDSYAEIWNRTNAVFGIDATVSRRELLDHMGQTIDVIFHSLMRGRDVDIERYLRHLDHCESTMMPVLGGRFYPGAIDGIRRLASRYRLFLVSNCGSDGLHNMMRFGDITDCFTDSLSYGETRLDKTHNIRLLIERHHLRAPLYIGDTRGDCASAHAAGIPMAHARWGFGACDDADLAFDDFPSMTRALLDLTEDHI